MLHDLKSVTTLDQRKMYFLVTIGVYAVLVALLRRPGICLYLIATVVLGYLASLGVTDLLFRGLHRGPAPWNGLDWTVAFFLFVILVGRRGRLQHLLDGQSDRRGTRARNDRGNQARRGPHRRNHQLLRIDHGGHVRLDAHRKPDRSARARLRPRARRPARHLPGPADPGSGLRDPARANQTARSRR